MLHGPAQALDEGDLGREGQRGAAVGCEAERPDAGDAGAGFQHPFESHDITGNRAGEVGVRPVDGDLPGGVADEEKGFGRMGEGDHTSEADRGRDGARGSGCLADCGRGEQRGVRRGCPRARRHCGPPQHREQREAEPERAPKQAPERELGKWTTGDGHVVALSYRPGWGRSEVWRADGDREGPGRRPRGALLRGESRTVRRRWYPGQDGRSAVSGVIRRARAGPVSSGTPKHVSRRPRLESEVSGRRPDPRGAHAGGFTNSGRRFARGLAATA